MNAVVVYVRRDRGAMSVARVVVNGNELTNVIGAILDVRSDGIGAVDLRLVVNDIVVVDEARPIPAPPPPTAQPAMERGR